jgi:hypothetical protein
VRDSVCSNTASDALHLVSEDRKHEAADPDIDSLLTQPTTDRRLLQINRAMYWSLHALDAELRKEQQLARCQQPSLPELEAQSPDHSGAGSGYSRGLAVADSGSHAPAQGITDPDRGNTGVAGSALVPGSARKASLLPRSGGGNGATAPNISPGSDDDIVARRLRNAAQQEADPILRAKLWKEYKEYTEYEQGTSAK